MIFIGLVKQGIINGYRDGQFGMNDQITREQAAQIIDNALDVYVKWLEVKLR